MPQSFLVNRGLFFFPWQGACFMLLPDFDVDVRCCGIIFGFVVLRYRRFTHITKVTAV